MNLYEVYYKQNSKLYKVLPYNTNFSIKAAIFSPIWALYHGLWYFLAIYAFCYYLTTFGNLQLTIQPIVKMALAAFFGIFAYDLRSLHIRLQGYKLCDVVCAGSQDEGEYKFYQKLRKNNDSNNSSLDKIWNE